MRSSITRVLAPTSLSIIFLATPLLANAASELGIDILYTTPSSSFANNVTVAKSVGAKYMNLGLGWNQIEPTTPNDCTTPGTYTDPYGALGTFNSLLPSYGLGLSLGVFPISTTIDLRPSNLKSLAFDNSLVICRYKMMMQYVLSKVPNVRLVSLLLGNEIDAFPSANTSAFWGQYWGFYVNASAGAKSIRPGVVTSVTGTLYGATGGSSNPLAKSGLSTIFQYADVVDVTYYPLNANFTVKNPSVVVPDINALVALYPSRQIYFNEIGYPSGSTYDASSQALQQQFVQQVFQVWNQNPSTISHINFVRLNDNSHIDAQNTATSYGLGSNNQFVEYLETLGLQTYGAVAKSAFTQIGTEMIPTADTTPPSTPTALSGTAISSSQINLTWTASTDNVGVTGYKVYRNSTQVGTSATNNYSDTGLTPSTVYSYTVSAYDAAENNSAQSATTSIITLGLASPAIAIGSRVTTIANLNVRSSASVSATKLGTESVGSLGTVVGGPTVANGHTWWQISYNNSIGGWSIARYLAPVAAVSSPAVGMIQPSHASLIAQLMQQTRLFLSQIQMLMSQTAAVGVASGK